MIFNRKLTDRAFVQSKLFQSRKRREGKWRERGEFLERETAPALAVGPFCLFSYLLVSRLTGYASTVPQPLALPWQVISPGFIVVVFFFLRRLSVPVAPLPYPTPPSSSPSHWNAFGALPEAHQETTNPRYIRRTGEGWAIKLKAKSNGGPA